MYGSNVIFEGVTSGNVITRTHKKFMGERSIMHYHPDTKHWVSEVSGRVLGFDWDDWLADDSVRAMPKDHVGEKGLKWNIFYCDGEN